MYRVCIEDHAKRELQIKSGRDLDLLDKRIEWLRNGNWKNGTRVKKLKAINRNMVIYEARVDKARRMLFSLVPSLEENNQTEIMIFHLAVEHDDVIRTARTIFQEEEYSAEEYQRSEEIVLDLTVEQKSWSEQNSFFQYIGKSVV